MDETRIDDNPQVTEVENETLTQSFLEAEVKDAIFQMKNNSAPRLMDSLQNFIRLYGIS